MEISSFHKCVPETTIIRGMVPEKQSETFFVILGHFLPFYPTNSPENQNFEKMKKESGDVTILHTCTTNHNHLMYAS